MRNCPSLRSSKSSVIALLILSSFVLSIYWYGCHNLGPLWNRIWGNHWNLQNNTCRDSYITILDSISECDCKRSWWMTKGISSCVHMYQTKGTISMKWNTYSVFWNFFRLYLLRGLIFSTAIDLCPLDEDCNFMKHTHCILKIWQYLLFACEDDLRQQYRYSWFSFSVTFANRLNPYNHFLTRSQELLCINTHWLNANILHPKRGVNTFSHSKY